MRESVTKRALAGARPERVGESLRELDRTLGRRPRLLDLQEPGGWWVGELESNVTMTAQHLLFLEFLRLRDEETTRAAWRAARAPAPGRTLVDLPRRRARSHRDARGVRGAPPRRALADDDPRLAAARRFCEERGGIGGARVFTRIWLSLFGIWPWEEVPQLPPELVLLPPVAARVSVYNFACWARQTVVALSVVMHYRPVRRLPPERACHELDLGRRAPSASRRVGI